MMSVNVSQVIHFELWRLHFDCVQGKVENVFRSVFRSLNNCTTSERNTTGVTGNGSDLWT